MPTTSSSERFRLAAGPCVPAGYPATIQEARFITPGGGSFPVPYGHFLEGDWGRSGIGWAVGDPLQPVPDSLEIRWFSYPENKFYEGHFLLPHEHLLTLLKQGFWDTEAKKKATYQGFTVCVLPTGGVVLWLDGAGRTALVGRYQAAPVNFDYQRYQPGVDRAADVQYRQAHLPPAVRKEIASGTVSSARWDAYLRRYSWQVAFSQPVTLANYEISYVNAEVWDMPLTADLTAYAKDLLTASPKPVPSSANLYVAGAYGRKRLLKISPFDEPETMAAFRTLHAHHAQEPITLYLDTDERLSKAALSLRAGGQIIPLLKSSVKLFDLP